jgi:hypothetical protein
MSGGSIPSPPTKSTSTGPAEPAHSPALQNARLRRGCFARSSSLASILLSIGVRASGEFEPGDVGVGVAPNFRREFEDAACDGILLLRVTIVMSWRALRCQTLGSPERAHPSGAGVGARILTWRSRRSTMPARCIRRRCAICLCTWHSRISSVGGGRMLSTMSGSGLCSV